MAAPQKVLVGMCDIHVSKGLQHYCCLGLGSCIGLVAYDKLADVSGMVHIMLPEAFKDKPVEKPGKFADTGLEELLKQMTDLGAVNRRLVVGYAGGAQVFKIGAGGDSRMDVGARNSQAVNAILDKLGIKPIAIDIGGSSGRTVMIDQQSGIVKVRTIVGGEKVLCNLKQQAGLVAA